MSSPTDNAASAPVPPAPAPSVFISYASEDRTAARALRDTLASAGLEVWYDEQELTGGDAWDQKIRRQIRDCDYFMPVISAATEARIEGYFRREWRLACERTLDMADDVLFIVPVTIDNTQEQGARVPDKFLAVQWLRAPAGHATPALHHLLRRLLAGERHAAPRSAGVTRAPFQRTQGPFPPLLTTEPPPDVGATPPGSAPPQMPPMPHVPEKGGFLHGIKFIIEVLWWALTAAWLLFTRMPKWVRALATVWIVITVFTYRCSDSPRVANNDKTPQRPPSSEHTTESRKKMRNLVDRLTQSARDGKFSNDPDEISKLASELAHGFSEGFNEVAATGKSLLVVPFGPPTAEDPGDKFAHDVFISFYGRIALAHRTDVGVTGQTKTELATNALIARGKRLNASFVLAAKATDAAPYVLTARLLKIADGSVVWSESYPVEGSDASAVAEKIGEQVFRFVPKKEPKKEKEKSNG